MKEQLHTWLDMSGRGIRPRGQHRSIRARLLVNEDNFITNSSKETDVDNVIKSTEEDAVDHVEDVIAEVTEVVGQVEAQGFSMPESSSYGDDKSVQKSGEGNQTHQSADLQASGHGAVSVDAENDSPGAQIEMEVFAAFVHVVRLTAETGQG